MFKNTASQSVTLLAIDSATGKEKTGDAANMVYYVSKDDGSVVAITSNSGVPTEIDSTNAKGLYKIALAQAETNGDKLLFSGKSSTSGIVVVPCVIYTDPASFTSLTIANNAVNANATYWGGTLIVATSVPVGTAAGASGGLFIAGSNAGTTISGLTTGALSCTTITASGAVAFQSTFAVTTSTALAALSCTTLTASGAVAFQSTFAVTTSTALAALSCSTLTASGAVALQSTVTVTGTTSLAALSTSGTATFNALTVTNATTLSGAVSLGSTLGVAGTTTFAAVAMTTLTASGAVAFQSTFAVTTSTSLAALSCTTLTASGAVALQSTVTVTGTTSLAALSTSGTATFNALTVTNATTLSGAVSLGSTLGITGATTLAAVSLTTLTASGAVAFQSTFAVSGTTTLTGAVTASNASNNIVGISLAAAGLDPVLVESSISASANLTNDANSQLTSINGRQALSLILSSAAAGVLAGAATSTITIKPGGLPAGNTRITATCDASGNRTALTLKVPT